MANPLLTHFTARLAAAVAALGTAQPPTAAYAALKAASDDLAARQNAFDLLVTQSAALDAGLAAKRRALATTTVPAEALALLEQIRLELLEQRAKGRALAAARRDLAAARAAHDAALDLQRDAAAAVAAAQAALAAAEADDKTWGEWILALDAAPLVTLQADAAAAKAAPAPASYAAAKARVDALPAALIALARDCFSSLGARRQVAAQAALDGAREHVAALAGLSGVTGAPLPLRATLDAAVTRLRAHVFQAHESFVAATARLAQIAEAPLLTAAELAALNAAGDVKTKGEAAAAKEAAFNAVLVEIDQKRAALDKRKRAALAKDPLANVANLAPEQADLDAAQAKLVAAPANEYPPLKNDLPPWLVNLPDAAFTRLIDFLAAEQTLDQLAALDAKVALVTGAQGLTAAQTALVAVLDAEWKAARQSRYLSRSAPQLVTLGEASANARAEDLLTALRSGL